MLPLHDKIITPYTHDRGLLDEYEWLNAREGWEFLFSGTTTHYLPQATGTFEYLQSDDTAVVAIRIVTKQPYLVPEGYTKPINFSTLNEIIAVWPEPISDDKNLTVRNLLVHLRRLNKTIFRRIDSIGRFPIEDLLVERKPDQKPSMRSTRRPGPSGKSLEQLLEELDAEFRASGITVTVEKSRRGTDPKRGGQN